MWSIKIQPVLKYMFKIRRALNYWMEHAWVYDYKDFGEIRVMTWNDYIRESELPLSLLEIGDTRRDGFGRIINRRNR